MKKSLILSFLLCLSCTKTPPVLHKAPTVKVVSATTCEVPVYLDYVGHLEANISVAVKAQVSGILVEQHFVEGSDVKQGDLILTIDPRPYEAALTKAKASLLETEASLEYAVEKTKRYAKLLEEEFVSKLDYDQYITNVLTSGAQVEQNKAEIQTAQINLGYCFIHAPMDCTTGLLEVKPGNYVDAGADTTLTVLNQIQPILVNFSIPEDDLYPIQMAQKEGPLKLEVFIDQGKTQSFTGHLSLINNSVSSETGTLLCQGRLANEDKLLWPGHFVDVRVLLQETSSEILLPIKAVMLGQAGHYVYLVGEGQTISMQAVQVGQRHGDFIVIKQGVKQKDLVVSEGQLNLYPGLKVEIFHE